MRTISSIAITALLLCAGVAHAAPSTRRCHGYITDADEAPIGVKIQRGRTPCIAAKRIVHAYLNSSAPCEGSACTRTHRGWTCQAASPANFPRVASCTRGRRLIAGYAIVD